MMKNGKNLNGGRGLFNKVITEQVFDLKDNKI